MDNLIIVKARNRQEIDKCMKMRHIIFVEEKKVPEDVQYDEQDKLNTECDHFLIEYKDENVGAFRCFIDKNDIIRIQRFCVLKEYRKSGMGRAAIECIENYYKKAHCKKIILDAKFEAKDFYKKCGYIQTSDVFMEAGKQHVRMEKVL